MKNFINIFIYNFGKQIKSTAFKVVTLILCILIIGVFGVTKIVNKDPEIKKILAVDNTGCFSNIEDWNSGLEKSRIELSDELYSDEDCKEKVLSQEDMAIIKLNLSEDNISLTIYDNNVIDSRDLQVIKQNTNNFYKYIYAKSIEINDEELRNLLKDIDFEVVQVDTSFEEFYLVSYSLLLLLVMAIMMYGSQVAGEITYAKTNRVMELLLTSASPISIFMGITLAIGLVGLCQLAFILMVAVGAYKIINPEILMLDGLKIDFSVITMDKLLIYIVFFIISYLIYAVLNAGIGSLISKNEDIMVAVLPITIISCLQLFTGLMAISKPDALISKVFSYIPFTSAGTMVMRYFLGNASSIEVMSSIIVLILSLVVIAYFSIRVFVNGVVYYGNFSMKNIVGFWRKENE
ncbi:MAG: ABC transporter permease [Clostridium sp.]|uniref:ABC transporter permease n=1 Tax=Clostridium sp. DSM 8431 TaxID=1761781 RepID=UPI0008F1DFD0|nr:ABC transporter permease [Clostridium sp. DSM 8431]MCR4943509.1 ABC transporter permease [Clostridium sp.]SFU64298.1 ABC-2 family transporter protein [Clostridium sp. DSM 8431]